MLLLVDSLCPYGVSRGPRSIFGILVIGGASRVSSAKDRHLAVPPESLILG